MRDIFIIAEAGVNHNGSLEKALNLIDAATAAGADAVKFQTFRAELMVCRTAEQADYQKKNIGQITSQYEMLKKLELSPKDHEIMMEHSNGKGIEFLSTPFDYSSINLLNRLGLETFKIPSGEITNLPYLRYIGKLGKKVILSTGMATMEEVEDALEILVSSGTPKCRITVLHANTQYPTPMRDVNLKAMLSIQKRFNVQVGYSDHALGIEVPIAAAALGASIIEKHFTIDRNLSGPDHKASLLPAELKQMVMAIRNIEKALGDGVKHPTESEESNISIARKSIVAKSKIKRGEVFTIENLTVKRPGTGMSPMKWDEVIGLSALKDYEPDDLIEQRGNEGN
jgi:N,N'-diacetyllegionaminate synthase